jgi:hypothetical protein
MRVSDRVRRSALRGASGDYNLGENFAADLLQVQQGEIAWTMSNCDATAICEPTLLTS